MKLIDFASYLIYIANYIVIVPIVVAVFFYKYLTRELKILLLGLSISFIFDVLIVYFSAKYLFIYIFSIIDTLTIAWMFSVLIFRKRIQYLILTCAFFLVGFIVIDAFYISGLENNGFSNALSKVYLLIITIYYFSLLLQNESIEDFKTQPLFWICIGLLSYHSIGLFDVFSKAMLSYSQYFYLQFYMIWCIAAIFMYSCFAVAFWKSKLRFN